MDTRVDPDPVSKTRAPLKPKRRWARRLCAGGVVLLGVVALTTLTATRPPADRMFRGKLESEWIENLKYNVDEQVDE